ncbi:hypothetical protein MMC15_000040 [Xylographa vitiligo]|nr:hypothetical protein [Xylographa vitiligo]
MPSNRSTTDDPSGSGNPDLYEYSIIFNSKVNDTSIALRKVNQRPSDTEFQKYISYRIKPTGQVVAFVDLPISALEPRSSTNKRKLPSKATTERRCLLVNDFIGTGINIEKDRSNGKVDAIYVEL